MSDKHKQTNGNEKPCTNAPAYNDLPRFTALIEQVRQKKTQNTTDHKQAAGERK